MNVILSRFGARLQQMSSPTSPKHETRSAGNPRIDEAGAPGVLSFSHCFLEDVYTCRDYRPSGSDMITIQYRASPMYFRFSGRAIDNGKVSVGGLRALVAEKLEEKDPWRINLVCNLRQNWDSRVVNLEEYDMSESVGSLGMASYNQQNLIHVDISDYLILRDSSSSLPSFEKNRINSIRYYAFDNIWQVKEKIARIRGVCSSKIQLSYDGRKFDHCEQRLDESGIGPGFEIRYQIGPGINAAHGPSSASAPVHQAQTAGHQEHKQAQRQPTAPAKKCSHKSFTSCTLSPCLPCCACADKRPHGASHTGSYPMYVDGIGPTMRGTRWQNYCPPCKAYWQKNPNTFPTIQVRSANSRIRPTNSFQPKALPGSVPTQRTASIKPAILKYREPDIPRRLRPEFRSGCPPSTYYDLILLIPVSGASCWMKLPQDTIRLGLTVSQLRTLIGRHLGAQDIWRVSLMLSNEAIANGMCKNLHHQFGLEEGDCQFGKNATGNPGGSPSLQSLGMKSRSFAPENVIRFAQSDYLLLQCQEKNNITFSVRFFQSEKVGEIRELLAKREQCLAEDIQLFFENRELRINDCTLVQEKILPMALVQWRRAAGSNSTKTDDRSLKPLMSSKNSKITGPIPLFSVTYPTDANSLSDDDLFILHEGNKPVWMTFHAGTIKAARLTFKHLRTVLADHLGLEDPWQITFFNRSINLESSEIESETFFPVNLQRNGPIKTFLSQYILLTGPERSVPISKFSLVALRSTACRMVGLPHTSPRIRFLYKDETFNGDLKELYANHIRNNSGAAPEITFVVDVVPSLEMRFVALGGKEWSQCYSEDEEISIGDIRSHAANRLGVDDVRRVQLIVDGEPLRHDLWVVNRKKFRTYFEAAPDNAIIVEASDYLVLGCEDDAHLIHFEPGTIDRGLVSVLRIRYEASKSLGKGFRVFNEEKIKLIFRERELKCSATPTLLTARDAGLLCGSELRCEFKEIKDRNQYLQDAEREVETRGVRGKATECSICGDTKPAIDFPKQITKTCAHEVNNCRKCLQSWIVSSLENRAWDKISCSECNELLLYSDVQTHASPEIFQKYDQLATRAALSTISEFRWCISPNGCTSGQIHESGPEGPIFRCMSCGFKSCTVHERAWHEGETCEEYDYRTDPKKKKAEDEASAKLVHKIAKNCPGCEWRIEKISGCDHMTCSRCNHEFCYLCSADYKKIREIGNSAHESSCRYHSNNIR